MPRSVPEWIGKTDDTPVPDRVRLRVLECFEFRCDGVLANGDRCGILLKDQSWTCDHKKALINGGENRESNLHPLGDKCCNPKKNAADVAEKSATYRARLKNYGVRRKPKGRPMPGTKASGIKKPFFGPPIDRRTGKAIGGRRI